MVLSGRGSPHPERSVKGWELEGQIWNLSAQLGRRRVAYLSVRGKVSLHGLAWVGNGLAARGTNQLHLASDSCPGGRCPDMHREHSDQKDVLRPRAGQRTVRQARSIEVRSGRAGSPETLVIYVVGCWGICWVCVCCIVGHVLVATVGGIRGTVPLTL